MIIRVDLKTVVSNQHQKALIIYQPVWRDKCIHQVQANILISIPIPVTRWEHYAGEKTND